MEVDERIPPRPKRMARRRHRCGRTTDWTDPTSPAMQGESSCCYYLPLLHQPANSAHPLLAPLLSPPPAAVDKVRVALSALVSHIGPLGLSASTGEDLLALVDGACAALSSVDQGSVLSINQNGEGNGLIACGVLTASMLVPLMRKASRLGDPDLAERLVATTGVLTSLIAGHGEHTMCIGLASPCAPLSLRCEPCGWCTGTRLWPAARLAIGACSSRWQGVDVRGKRVLEIGCGTAACGLACAALGAACVWLTDWDDGALSLARRNAEHNGLGATCHAAKLDFMRGFDPSDDVHGGTATRRPEGMPAGFDLVLAADVLYDWGGSWRETLRAVARHLDAPDGDARALCVFGQQKRSEAAREACDAFEAAAMRGDAGLRCLASEEVREEGREEGIRMLLLAPT